MFHGAVIIFFRDFWAYFEYAFLKRVHFVLEKGISMKKSVFLLKDIKNVGKAGTIVSVAEGYATNYVLPQKLGVLVTEKNKSDIDNRLLKIEQTSHKEKAKTSALAEQIESITITLKNKIGPDGKLYGAIRSQMIADELAKEGISIGKSMVIFDKQIKEKGIHEVTIKLSSSLQPKLKVKVIAE